MLYPRTTMEYRGDGSNSLVRPLGSDLRLSRRQINGRDTRRSVHWIKSSRTPFPRAIPPVDPGRRAAVVWLDGERGIRRCDSEGET